MRPLLRKPSDPASKIISFMTLRRSVGLFGFFLPPVLVLGSFILDHTNHIQVSISAYYYTHMRNVLVGTLCCVSLFLICYHGYKWYDSLVSKSAGLFALGIAFFPTAASDAKDDIISKLHYITAGIFFVLLAIMSLFLFTKSSGVKTPRKKMRNRIYRFCGIMMFISVVGIPLDIIPAIHDRIAFLKPTLVLETSALIFFGISWLTKGEALAIVRDK